MYFLRWLYREVNPMILILGLVMLYFLLNLATCSNNRHSADVDTDVVKTQDIKTQADTTKEVIATADTEEAESREKVVEMTDTEGQQVESALTKVFKDKQVDADVSDANEEVKTVDKSTKPSILSRVFKKPTDEVVADAEPGLAADVKEVTLEAVEDASKTGAVVTGTAVATAGAIAAVAGDDADAAIDNSDVVNAEVEALEVEVVEKEKGGFLGIFNRSSKSEEDEVEQAEEVASTEASTEDTEAEDVAVEEVAVEEAPVDEVAVEEVIVEEDPAELVAVEQELVEDAPAEAVVVENETVEEAAVVGAEADDEVAKQTDAAVPPPPSYNANISTDTEGLSAARRAYWDRDYAAADTLYSSMIENEPGNAELIAEYGNMLLQSGQVEKTLDAYETAAGLMIDSGRKLEAKPLIDYISSWDQARADALINKVFAQ